MCMIDTILIALSCRHPSDFYFLRTFSLPLSRPPSPCPWIFIGRIAMSGSWTKGSFSESSLNGSSLRIAVIHTRMRYESPKATGWAFLRGVESKLKAVGVEEKNIVFQSVPSSYELPMAVSKYITPLSMEARRYLNLSLDRMITGSRAQAAATAVDLLDEPTTSFVIMPPQPFDAVIAIAVLAISSVMDFDYVPYTVPQGLMRIQLDTGVPVVYGAIPDYSTFDENTNCSYGREMGLAAVEMAVDSKRWSEGKLQTRVSHRMIGSEQGVHTL